MDNKYYAADEINVAANKIMEIVRFQQQKMFASTGIANVWNRNAEIYYKNAITDVLNYIGEQGELIGMSVPQARSLVRQVISIVTKQKLNFQATMRSNDYAAFSSGQIAEAIANQLVKEKRLNEKLDKLAELAYIHGQSFWHVTWDSEGGRVVAQPGAQMPMSPNAQQDSNQQPQFNMTPQPIMSGDVNISVASAKYVYYDWNCESWDDLPCVVVAQRVNRWDMIAQHPEMEEELKKVPSFSRIMNGFSTTISAFDDIQQKNNDLILVYHYYHKPTPAVPSGRMVILCSETCILHDGVNPYECLPVVPCIPEKMEDFLLGYPQFSNLAPLQDMLDVNFSTMASNQAAFGIQSVLNPRGSNIDITQINGMQWIDYTPQGNDGGGKPEALQLTKSAPEVIDGIKIYIDNLSTLANVNGALRGTPPPGVTAGNAIATLTANSIEFFSSYSKSVYQSIEELITLAVKFYKMFGAEQQLVQIADGNTSYTKEFQSSDLKDFQRVTLEVANPLMNTIAGRRDQAELLLSKGLVKDIGDYFMVLEGEPPKRIYNSQLNETSLIQKENDDLMKGMDCPVLFTDDHQLHIDKHKDILRNPEIRRNGQFVQVVLEHLQQHQQMLMQQMQPQQPPQGAPAPNGEKPQMPNNPQPNQSNEPQSAPAQPAQAKVSF